ncbi:hypothetical protein PHYPSEUDO_009159 [Phytophthora pseudosyringae]|uniref:Uncharacterized protein n=1 Tax=Phytophthora pseudosyringae TaxID=221518 RepID=A0A8T1VFS1_9STRA|nr:hypothetical protein PHYPSEUDO_009159 [Phytophthora pseudosyringae]
MESDSDEDFADDVDAICGWGAADFDDELLGRGRRRVPQLTGKYATKPKPQKSLSTSGLQPRETRPPLKNEVERAAEPPSKQNQQQEPSSKNKAHAQRKLKRNQPQDTQESASPKLSPRTIFLRDEPAALGRQRRMKIVAAALASNVPRKSCIGSVVSASFDVDPDDEQDELESMRRRRPDEWLPSSAPGDQLQEKLSLVTEPSTAPAGSVEAPKKIHPLLPLPLLSIKPDCGGQKTRLLSKDAPAAEVPRHWRRQRQKKTRQSSLLPTQDVSDNWESNFYPALRRASRSPGNYKAEFSHASNDTTSSLPRVVQVPSQEYAPAFRPKEHWPSINRITKESNAVAVPDNTWKSPTIDQDETEGGDEDDESWTHCYDDPEVLATSMAGLIQALSTFAADGKPTKAPKGGKRKKRRAKQHHEPQQKQTPHSPPFLRLPPPGEISFTSTKTPITGGSHEAEPSVRRRKHRKLRSKHSSDSTIDKMS